MTLDPQMKLILDMAAAAGAPPVRDFAPVQARAEFARRMGFFRRGEPEAVGRIEDLTIAGPHGPIPIRLYYPKAKPPIGAAMFFHGGGWVIGNLETHDSTCRERANGSGVMVAAVDYRLAPENKFPAAADDCYAATEWIAEHAADLGYPAGRLAVSGDSAGGNLAAVVALMARDRRGPLLRYQLLIYPALDPELKAASHSEFDRDGYVLSRADMVWFWNHYLRNQDDVANSYVNPARAKNLAGLPPALVITAGFDPLRDEGEAYAELLRKAGVPVECTRYGGLTHGFFNMASHIDEAKKAVAQACAGIRAAMA
ncbi:MAG: alpha/beta hydrolase [Candidatus Binataceae bacterium]|nr:alpha/beta hydrolase [Candidatus Binataceae bacterium]